MNKIIYSVVFTILITMLHTGCSSGPYGGSYTISAQNISQQGGHGVILIEPTFDKDQPIQLNLVLPKYGSNSARLAQLKKRSKFLTDELKVVWQLAELSDCDKVLISRINPKNKRTRGCTFTPIPGKVYSKTIDMIKIYNSEAGKKAGKVASYGLGGAAYYTIGVVLIFNNDQLDVTWGIGQTNPWN